MLRVAQEIISFTGDNLLSVQTVLVEEYWAELRRGLSESGLQVLHLHLLLDADDSAIRARILADENEPGAKQWRLDHLDVYARARPWMVKAADAVVDSTEVGAEQVSQQILDTLG